VPTHGTAGFRRVSGTDIANGSISGTQTGINVNATSATSLVVAGLTSPRTVGAAGSITVTAKDSFGNTATGYRGTVHFTSSDALAGLPANYTFTAGDAGAKLTGLTVTLNTAGTQSVSTTNTVTSSILGAQTGIVVNP
jgi:hypothetical protein